MNIINRCKEGLKATNGTCHSNDMRKNDDRISTYLDDSNGKRKSNNSVREGSLLHNIYGMKKIVLRKAISDHTYRKILRKESNKYQQ